MPKITFFIIYLVSIIDIIPSINIIAETMAKLLSDYIHHANPQSLEKYISHYLPQQQSALKSLYASLKEYKLKPKITVFSVEPRSSNAVVKTPYTPSQKTSRLFRTLTEKGIKPQRTSQSQKHGFKLYNQQKGRIFGTKTQTRSIKTKIGQQIQRYNLNREIYSKVEHQDQEIAQFIKKREAILKNPSVVQSIKKRKNTTITAINHLISNGDDNNCSKVGSIFSRKKDNLSNVEVQSLPMITANAVEDSAKRNSQGVSYGMFTDAVMYLCNNYLQEKPNIPKNNLFFELQKKIDEEDFMDMQKEQIIQQALQSLGKEQLQRYTHTYMKILSHKSQPQSNHKKDLLRDENKMRNIIDFSQL